MVIKATRVRTSTGAKPLLRHLLDGEDNEAIMVVQGHVGDIVDAVRDAKAFSRIYAVRHWVIAPAVEMNRDQFHQAASMLAEEFDFNLSDTLIVEHAKARAVAGVADRHWHLVVPETNPVSGRVLSSKHDHARHEKVARQIEFLFGHPAVPGAHDRAVLAALRLEGKVQLADWFDAQLGQDPRPIESFSSSAHQAAKKLGIDLAQVRQHVRAAWKNSITGDDFRARLGGHGLELAKGDKPGVLVIRTLTGHTVLGAANRLAGVRRAELNLRLERKDHDQPNHASKAAEHRADDPHGYAGVEAGHGNDSGTGPFHRATDGRREGIGAGHDDLATSNDRRWRGAEQEKLGSLASKTGRARDRSGLAADDRCRLNETITKVATTIMALSKSGIGQSQIERAREHLAAQEVHARARIAAAEAHPPSHGSSKLNAARLYKQGAEKRYDTVLKQYREAQERLAASPEPKRTAMDRLFGRQAAQSVNNVLERDLAAIHADLVVADRTLNSAIGHLARVEKAETAAQAASLRQRETERREGINMLAEIKMAQRVVQVFPATIYSGPAFAEWVGQKIERGRRKGLRNPLAKDLWGIPLDFI